MSETEWAPEEMTISGQMRPWTPGPLTSHGNTVESVRAHYCSTLIATTSMAPHFEDAERNASLIAAAPDLYDALQAALASLDADPSRSPLRDKEARAAQAWLRGIWGDKARAALAKARGE